MISYYSPDASFPPILTMSPKQKQSYSGDGQRVSTPQMCKPWLDGAMQGCILTFPYQTTLTVSCDMKGHIRCEVESLRAVKPYGSVISSFSDEYFGLATNYTLRTPKGIATYICNPPDDIDGCSPACVRATIETWWYPRPMFLVYPKPAPSASLSFSFGQVLCMLIPVIPGPAKVQRMSESEIVQLREAESLYLERTNDPMLKWTAADGNGFSHAYKYESRTNRVE